jgi:toxin-antitoxin system PIN domain toxin
VNLCDSNVWLALVLSKHAHHRSARRWFDSIEQAGSVAFCRQTQQTLLRLLTNAAVLGAYGNDPLTNDEAWEAYSSLLADDRVVCSAVEPPGVEAVWAEYSRRGTASPKLWMDAYLAAFALCGGHTLVTSDSGFRQFRGVDLVLLG